MANFANDGMLSTPKQTLEEALQLISEPGPHCWNRSTRLLVLSFDDANPEYEIALLQCGFRYPELLLALEMLRLRIVREAGL
jgi:hypothetical protein